jgi:hypothetical protein
MVADQQVTGAPGHTTTATTSAILLSRIARAFGYTRDELRRLL